MAEMSNEARFNLVMEHISDMERGTFGTFFAPEGGPSYVNEVRAESIATDYLDHRGWHLREEWAADLEEFIHDNHHEYELIWWDEEGEQ